MKLIACDCCFIRDVRFFRSLPQRLFFYFEKPNKLIDNFENVYVFIILNYVNM